MQKVIRNATAYARVDHLYGTPRALGLYLPLRHVSEFESAERSINCTGQQLNDAMHAVRIGLLFIHTCR